MTDGDGDMIVQSLGTLTETGTTAWYPALTRSSLRLYDSYYYDYAALYRSQPNVRVCVDFLARNLAQLGLHVFRRVSDTDRVRLTDHPLAVILGQPNPWTTRYRLIEGLMSDMGIYFNAYWLKIPRDGTLTYLLRVPPHLVTVYGNLSPRGYKIDLGNELRDIDPKDMVHFRGYNPEDATVGMSPLETLRRILAEEQAMGDYREHFWQNSARMHGIIERPREAPQWSLVARERFKAEFEALYSGGENSGRTAILEEGMSWKEATFNAQESEYMLGRKLTREECARQYHIPLPMVGILDHATFSNISEQHKNLYQDTIGPWAAMLEQDIELQLLNDFTDTNGVYCEFNIAEKLQGSFEEQAKTLQMAIGRPFMTANEGRAIMNLPRMDGSGADELVTPLNVLVGGQASPQDSAPKGFTTDNTDKSKGISHGDTENTEKNGGKASIGHYGVKAKVDPTWPDMRERHEAKWRQLMEHFFRRQREAIIGKVGGGLPLDVLWDVERWNKELAADLLAMSVATAVAWARQVALALELELDEDVMEPWLTENAKWSALHINETTKTQVGGVLEAEDPLAAVKNVFEVAITARAAEIATSRVTTTSTFGAQEAAKQGDLKTKTWQVNSSNPRDEHAAMDGETVGIGDLFSNGLRWPGDPAGGAENNANCRCSCVFGSG